MKRTKSAVLVSYLMACMAYPLMLHAEDANVCEKLAKADFPGTTITSATSVAAGALQLPPSPLGAAGTSKAPALCRVQGTIHPSSDSNISFELWMPETGWNGKYLQLGNGGLAGSIDVNSMVAKVTRGFATAATDDGHKGSGTDGSWGIGHPEKVKDFGYRAVHETNDVAKKIIAQFYGSAPKYSYFNGCSEGGREAMIEAQRYPHDFNGILAGAPAQEWTDLMAMFAWNAQALNSKESYIPVSKRPAIENAALAACPAARGVDDKFIDDPLSCHFDPSTLLCKGVETDACLTAPQLDALKKIYSGPKNSRTGAKIGVGYVPGAEAEPGFPGLSYVSYIYGSGPGVSLDAIFSSAVFGGFVVEDPKRNFAALNFDSDISLAKQKIGPILDANNPDLSAFKAAGGKLLHYHGWYDGSPSPLQSVNYYEAVEKKQGGLEKTQEFYRLYMVPGMMHCGTGPGPNIFGNAFDLAPAADANHNIAIALEQWVEKGVIPEAIIATKYVEDNREKGIAMTRPLCAYPSVAQWNGKGDAKDAANWQCSVTERSGKKNTKSK